jgi:hypothetical protein
MLKTRDVCAACLGIALVFAVSWPAWSFAVPRVARVADTATPPVFDRGWGELFWCSGPWAVWTCAPIVKDPVFRELEPSEDPPPCPPPPIDTCDPNNGTCE